MRLFRGRCVNSTPLRHRSWPVLGIQVRLGGRWAIVGELSPVVHILNDHADILLTVAAGLKRDRLERFPLGPVKEDLDRLQIASFRFADQHAGNVFERGPAVFLGLVERLAWSSGVIRSGGRPFGLPDWPACHGGLRFSGLATARRSLGVFLGVIQRSTSSAAVGLAFGAALIGEARSTSDAIRASIRAPWRSRTRAVSPPLPPHYRSPGPPETSLTTFNTQALIGSGRVGQAATTSGQFGGCFGGSVGKGRDGWSLIRRRILRVAQLCVGMVCGLQNRRSGFDSHRHLDPIRGPTDPVHNRSRTPNAWFSTESRVIELSPVTRSARSASFRCVPCVVRGSEQDSGLSRGRPGLTRPPAGVGSEPHVR